MSKTIFITGASRGFGKLWAEALLNRGDKVAVTARKLSDLDNLVNAYGDSVLPIQLDVNDRAQGFAAVQKAKDHFGTIDVVINNAGYGLFGTIEETTEEQARQQFETNVFGLLWITQAFLPIFREQGHGHIVQVSSVLGVVTLPLLGIYNASKWAVEGLSESLYQEVKDFGINVTLIEPNGFSTDWGGASAFHTEPIAAYDEVRKNFSESMQTEGLFGDPAATSKAVLLAIDSEHPPLRLFLGKHAKAMYEQAYSERIATWKRWEAVSAEAHGA